MILSPGNYLARRRRAAGLSIADVAAQIETEPRIPEIDRIKWLGRIEEDVAAISDDVVARLRFIFTFDAGVLQELIDARSYGDDGFVLSRISRICACTDEDPCVRSHGETCAWQRPDLCTFCAVSADAGEVAA